MGRSARGGLFFGVLRQDPCRAVVVVRLRSRITLGFQVTQWYYLNMEAPYTYYEMRDYPERPDPGDGDDTCKHGKVTYGAGDCEECDAEDAAAEEALIASYPEYIEPDPCNACGGELGVLGTLGLMQHLECRDCGLPHSRLLKEVTA